MRAFWFAIGLLAVTAGMAAAPQARAAGAVAASSIGADEFLIKAAAADLFVSQSSELAMREARDPAIRAYAATIVKQQRPVTRGLRAVVDPFRWRMTVNEGAIGEFQPELPRLLFAAQRGEFDRAYLDAQLSAQGKLAGLLAAFAKDGVSSRGIGAAPMKKLRAAARTMGMGVAANLAEATRLAGTRQPPG